jgi:hypothetical protein
MSNPNGAFRINGVPMQGSHMTTGSVYFVDSSTGSSSNSGETIASALDTLDNAINKCTANKGDTIYVMPSHAETTGQTIMDIAGVHVQGLGVGLNRPSFTSATAQDVITVTGADCSIDNIQFAVPGVDLVTAYVNIAADGFVGTNWYAADCSSGTDNVVDCISITADGDNCLLENITFFNKTAPVTCFVDLEGAASNVRIKNSTFFGDTVTGGIIDTAKIDYLELDHVTVGVVGATMPAITLDSNPEGIARDCFFAGTQTTLALTANMGNLMRLHNIFVVNETDGSAQGAPIPAIDVAS